MDFAQVERALDWAKRSGYVDGEAAGEAFARITGRTMSIRDGGLYPDGLEWMGPQVIAAPDLLAACLGALQSAEDMRCECPGADELRAAIAKATGNPA